MLDRDADILRECPPRLREQRIGIVEASGLLQGRCGALHGDGVVRKVPPEVGKQAQRFADVAGFPCDSNGGQSALQSIVRCVQDRRIRHSRLPWPVPVSD
ncbi:MAG TPA: hypothetical protein VGG99_30080 [Acetobacteraceae bacterium]